MLIENLDEVRRLISSDVREGAAIEYKQELTIGSSGERKEALKDLTALGNAGGGVLIYGVSEDPKVDGKPEEILPLSDRSLPPRLEDIALAGVRPPLVWQPVSFELEDGSGFVLVANVRRSPLGPYMVESYGDRRYYIRIGSRSVKMTEQQVSDAYALALREAELEERAWESHQLPMTAPSSDPWLILSAVPRGPMTEVFEPAAAQIQEARLPDFMKGSESAQFSRLDDVTSRLSVWSGGITGSYLSREDTPLATFRFHRTAAASIGLSLGYGRPHDDEDERLVEIAAPGIAHIVNAYLAYFSWLWTRCNLTQPVVLDIRLEHLARTVLRDVSLFPESEGPVQPPAAPEAAAGLRTEVDPWRLQDALVRHTVVRDFSTRLYNAFGKDLWKPMFEMGWLYGAAGAIDLSVAGGGVFTASGQEVGHLEEGGTLRDFSGEPVGFIEGGVVVDLEGNCLAALEFATGRGIPPEFFLRRIRSDPRPKVPGGRAGERKTNSEPCISNPNPSRKWSELRLSSLLRPGAQ